MQYPVPQFTDVEDKIFGPLTLKQFGIVGGAGLIVFLFYSATKDLLITVFAGFLIGVPALGLAFGKVNGRPLYNSISSIAGFFLRPKQMLYHKQGSQSFHLLRKKDDKKEMLQPVSTEKPESLKDMYVKLKKEQVREDELVRQTKI